jgi:hypothetical protein
VTRGWQTSCKRAVMGSCGLWIISQATSPTHQRQPYLATRPVDRLNAEQLALLHLANLSGVAQHRRVVVGSKIVWRGRGSSSCGRWVTPRLGQDVADTDFRVLLQQTAAAAAAAAVAAATAAAAAAICACACPLGGSVRACCCRCRTAGMSGCQRLWSGWACSQGFLFRSTVTMGLGVRGAMLVD